MLFSCGEDFLSTEPHTYTDAAYWETADQAEAALAGVYTPFQEEEALGGEEWCGMECFSDNAYLNDNSYSDFESMSEFTATQNTEGDLSQNSYSAYYQVIKRANDVLANVPDMDFDDADQQDRILGEANFLMAFAYFQLTIRYGGLPIYDVDDSEAALVRASQDSTWGVIEDALITAEDQLTWDHSQGRPGLGAVYGLLAKVYAYQENWSDAKDAAETVIKSGYHDLYADYRDLFTIDNETDNEFLWSLGAREDEYPITPVLLLPNNVWNGLHDESEGEGWRLVSPTDSFYNSYLDGDLRKEATVAWKEKDTVTYNGSTDIIQAPNNKSNVVCIKYMQPYAEEYTGWRPGLDVPAVRYADVLLIEAEAIMNLNGGGPDNSEVGVSAAAEYFNLVHERAGLAAIAAPTFNDLVYERRMEMAFEGGDRHFDLVRWGMAQSVYNGYPAEGTYKPERTYDPEVHNLLPYPQEEIDNSNGTITQNPGYTE